MHKVEHVLKNSVIFCWNYYNILFALLEVNKEKVAETFLSDHTKTLIEGIKQNLKRLKRKSWQNPVNPHVHKIFLQLYCMKWVPGDPQKEILN